MNLTDALERISAIHEHLAKAEVYRGYHPLTVALSGVAGLAAAALQPWFVAPEGPLSFLQYWLLVGAGCTLLGVSPTLVRGLTTDDDVARRRTGTVVGQFLPCLVAGGAATFALSHSGVRQEGIEFLPGLWALFFGLGIVASRPYLPRSAIWVAGWYLVAGLVVLLGPEFFYQVSESLNGVAFLIWQVMCHYLIPSPLSGWVVGVPFGVGQLLMALVFQSARRDGEANA